MEQTCFNCVNFLKISLTLSTEGFGNVEGGDRLKFRMYYLNAFQYLQSL